LGSSEHVIEGGNDWSLPLQQTKVSLAHKVRGILKYFGPAFIVSVAYIDPGNFGTNISGGSLFNYDLLWVILASNLMAVFLQIISAKLGIATGKNLPTLCGEVFSRHTNWVLWVIAEIAAIATDLAEFLGGALGFYLLLHIPMLWAGLLTGAVTFSLVCLEKYGHRLIEVIIGGLVAVISFSYVIELFLAKPDWSQVAYHCVVPNLNNQSLLVAVGMLGATVMPHVIYLHSHLVQPRRRMDPDNKRHLFREKIDVFVAMNIAFVINAAMVIVSAAAFHSRGIEVVSIEQAHQTLAPLLGPLSSAAFGAALLASGLSSSAVGTMSGQIIMQGFVGVKVSKATARLITMTPAMVIIGLGFNPMYVLVLSQVVLSFALPAAIISLLVLSNKRELMGNMVNSLPVKVIGILIAGAIISLNLVLLYQTFNS